MTIEDLDTNYCDDFVCTSSPAIEQTVRSLANDLTKLRYTNSLFQPDCKYEDGFRKFKGPAKYKRPFWFRDGLKKPSATINKLQMLDKGTALINWTLSGQVAMFNVQIPFSSVFELNLLTGRVSTHKESWDLSKLSPPAAAACVLSRVAWSAKQASQDAQDKLGKAADSISSLTSMEDDTYYQNPSDPTRFFQQDNGMGDVFMMGTLVAALYLAYRVFAEIENLH
eukprot:jgi/Chrzof1/10690/Cz05g08220.t1